MMRNDVVGGVNYSDVGGKDAYTDEEYEQGFGDINTLSFSVGLF